MSNILEKSQEEPMPFYLPGLHSRIYKNHRHKMIRHTKLIDHILRLPSLNAALQFDNFKSFYRKFFCSVETVIMQLQISIFY